MLRVASVDEAVAKANASPTGKPLVSYYYGQHPANADAWMGGTRDSLIIPGNVLVESYLSRSLLVSST